MTIIRELLRFEMSGIKIAYVALIKSINKLNELTK